jgi:hypothetical protein
MFDCCTLTLRNILEKEPFRLSWAVPYPCDCPPCVGALGECGVKEEKLEELGENAWLLAGDVGMLGLVAGSRAGIVREKSRDGVKRSLAHLPFPRLWPLCNLG